MRLQRRGLSKPLPAVLAPVRFLSRVDAHVNLRILQRLEPLLANLALEGPLSRVVHHVQSQLHRPRERLPAPSKRTLKRFDARV